MFKLYKFSFFYLLLGLFIGVFEREFIKAYDFVGQTQLSGLDVYIIVLGFIFLLLLEVMDKTFNIVSHKRFTVWFVVYNFALLSLVFTLLYVGMAQITGMDIGYVGYVADAMHLLFGASLIWFMLMIKTDSGYND